MLIDGFQDTKIARRSVGKKRNACSKSRVCDCTLSMYYAYVYDVYLPVSSPWQGWLTLIWWWWLGGRSPCLTGISCRMRWKGRSMPDRSWKHGKEDEEDNEKGLTSFCIFIIGEPCQDFSFEENVSQVLLVNRLQWIEEKGLAKVKNQISFKGKEANAVRDRCESTRPGLFNILYVVYLLLNFSLSTRFVAHQEIKSCS